MKKQLEQPTDKRILNHIRENLSPTWESHTLLFCQSTANHHLCHEQLTYITNLIYTELYTNIKQTDIKFFKMLIEITAENAKFYELEDDIRLFFQKFIKELISKLEDYDLLWACYNLQKGLKIIEDRFRL